MSLSDHLTLKQPLGPHNQSLVKDPRDATELLEGAAPFLDAIADHATIILGRRGSGKSSVLHGMRADIRFGHTHGRFKTAAVNPRDLVLPFLNWNDFHVMATRVGRELNFLLKTNPDPDFLFDATISDIWQYFIWEGIFTQINVARAEGIFSYDAIHSLAPVFEFFNLASISSTDMSSSASQKLVTNAQNGLVEYLNSRNKLCHVLFDNLDEYPIRNPLIESVVSGFLRAVHEINENCPSVKIVICIPEELEAYLIRHSANIDKDFTATHRMRWKPIDLLQIVAYRYRCFMELNDVEFYESIKKLDFGVRKDVVRLFNRILPSHVMNRLGYKEPSLSYVIRHTQLIPRHFILLFNAILLKAHVQTGGFRLIDEQSIVAGVAEGEKHVAAQILQPFEKIYPRLIQSTRLLLSNLPAICNESDLDKIHGRFKERIEEDVVDIWSTLHEIGILGMVNSDQLEVEYGSTQTYIYARWHYNSMASFSKNDRQSYCIHPIFSSYYGLVRKKDCLMKALYPADIPISWD